MELVHVLGSIAFLFAIWRLVPYFLRSWRDRNHKDVAVVGVCIFIAAVAIWLLVDALIPPSEKTVHRGGAHVGLIMSCKRSPRFKDCEPGESCTVCESRVSCLEAVDKYADRCFNSIYEQWDKVSLRDFYILLDTCVNQKASCEYFKIAPAVQ